MDNRCAGAELDVLIGAGSLLEICNVLQVEVSTREVYKGETSWIYRNSHT